MGVACNNLQSFWLQLEMTYHSNSTLLTMLYILPVCVSLSIFVLFLIFDCSSSSGSYLFQMLATILAVIFLSLKALISSVGVLEVCVLMFLSEAILLQPTLLFPGIFPCRMVWKRCVPGTGSILLSRWPVFLSLFCVEPRYL